MATSRSDDGFSLVELLTVIVILGVLAAIAVPTFLGQRQKAFRSAMVSDLRTLVTAQESRAVDGNPMYTDSIPELREQGYESTARVPAATVLLFTSSGAPQYVACVKHEAQGEWLVYNSVTGVTTYSPVECTAPLST